MARKVVTVVYALLNLIRQVVRVCWMTLRYAVAGLMLAAAVVAIPYLLAMFLLWLRAQY